MEKKTYFLHKTLSVFTETRPIGTEVLAKADRNGVAVYVGNTFKGVVAHGDFSSSAMRCIPIAELANLEMSLNIAVGSRGDYNIVTYADNEPKVLASGAANVIDALNAKSHLATQIIKVQRGKHHA